MAKDSSIAAVGFFSLPIYKQMGLLIGLALSIAMGFYVVLWSQEPVYVPIYAHLKGQDSAQMVSTLQQNGIQYKLDSSTGAVLIPAETLHEARLKLAASGVPDGMGVGLELLDKKSSFGTSFLVEQTRYLRGMQGEMEKTIASIDNIKSARVHLAIPKTTSFVRHKKRPTASVLVNIRGGYELEMGQVAAIRHLVSASIQGMNSQDVSIVDQNGRLLSESGQDAFAIASKQMGYTHQLEEFYAKRIYDLLAPMVGQGKVRAEVTAMLDFTIHERTMEEYDPKKATVRSEKVLDVSRLASDLSQGGIPGALTNQPPETASLVPSGAGENAAESNEMVDRKKQYTKNYELNRTIRHESKSPGKIMKLSVAVLLDDKVTYNKSGKATTVKFDEESINEVTELVKNAIGFDEERGDAVKVINRTFAQVAPIEELPPEAIFEKAWFPQAVKQGAGALLVLLLLFTVLRPMMKSLSRLTKEEQEKRLGMEKKFKELEQQRKSDLQAIEQEDDTKAQSVERMAELVHDDPKRVAQVVRSWVSEADA